MPSYEAFIGIGNGAQVFNHGWDQCVALANLYHEDVIGGSFVPVASAYQWWTDFASIGTLQKHYYRVPVNEAPQVGDIFVARGGIYNALDGHIGVVTRSWDGRTFGTMEQNAGTWRYVGRYNRGKANILGFLRPYKNPAVPERETPTAPPEPTYNRKAIMAFDLYWTGPTPRSAHDNARIITAHGSFHVPTWQIYELLRRRRDATLTATPGVTTDDMLDAEHDIINSFLRACFQSSMSGLTFTAEQFRQWMTDALRASGRQITVAADTTLTDADLGDAVTAAAARAAQPTAA